MQGSGTVQALESRRGKSGVHPDDAPQTVSETQDDSLEDFEMAVTWSQIVQDPTAWPWPGGLWRVRALDRPAATRRRGLVPAPTVALVAFQAVVLVVAVSVAAVLGETGFPDVAPGRAAVPAVPSAPQLPPEPAPWP